MGNGHHSVTGTYGSLTIDPVTGKYVYTLDTAKNGAADKLGLNADGTPQTGTDTFTIYVRDEHGAWSEQTVTITVNGSNDKPVIANTGDTLTITESGVDANNKDIPGTKSDSGKVDASDVDTGDTLTYFFSNTIEQGTVIGSLTLANGTKTNITVTSIGPQRGDRHRLRHVPSEHQDRRLHVHEDRIHRQRHRSAPARRQGGTRLLHQREGFPRRNGFEHA